MSSGFLHRYFLSNHGKRLHKLLHYFDIYERHFERFRNRPMTMLEIGVYGGGSLEMWRSYFGAEARIVGLDIAPACREHAGERIDVVIGDQTDPATLDAMIAEHGPFDIILDDGSHMMDHTITSFEYLYEHITPTGVYMIEDMHVAYTKRHGGGLRAEGSFIEYTKARIDDLHGRHWRGKAPPSAFAQSTDAICVYDGVIVFERRPKAMWQGLITGAEAVLATDRSFQKLTRREG